ncbi:MAG: 4Fe-4S ferredoxin [Methanothrix sp.]|nr:MAG: 4Fe-4S ferredoxin [Methanothrix sp.]
MILSKTVYADISRCIACHACEVACEKAHGAAKIFVDVVRDRASVPVSCCQCEKATCVMVCYPGALSQDNGSITFDPDRCTGCDLCVLACPFGAAVQLEQNAVRRCDLCSEREVPACVVTCPSQALIWDDVESISREIRKRAAAEMGRSLASGRVL